MGVLDDLGITAFRAYSTRKVRTAFAGNCLRVRRDSDSTESDIGWDGDDLDVAAIASFCGTSAGYVVTWYDQSTNEVNLTQSTAARQLLIYDGEFINTVGDAAMPALLRQYVDPSNNDFMQSSTTWAIPDAMSCHVAFDRPTAGQSMRPLLKNGYFYNGPAPFWHSDDIVYWRPGAGDFSNTDPDGSTHAYGSASTATGLFTLLGARSSTARQVYRNGASLGTISDDYNNPVWDADASYLETNTSNAVYSICEIIVVHSTLSSTDASNLYESVDAYWNGSAPPTFPFAVLQTVARRSPDQDEVRPSSAPTAWRWSVAAAPAPFALHLVARGRRGPADVDQEPRVGPRIDWMWSRPPELPRFILRRDRRAEVVVEDRVQRRGLDWLQPPAAAPTVPLVVLLRRPARTTEVEDVRTQRQQALPWIFQAPVTPPEFPKSLLRARPAPQHPEIDGPRLWPRIDYRWPPPPPPVHPWRPWMRSDRRDTEPVIERPSARSTNSRLYDWYPGQATEALAVVFAGLWSPSVQFLAGDEWRVTVSGPAATNPRIRISLKFENPT